MFGVALLFGSIGWILLSILIFFVVLFVALWIVKCIQDSRARKRGLLRRALSTYAAQLSDEK
jgi:formate-dependent nitrite reductase membrane component NrfD